MAGLQGNFRIAVPASTFQYTLTPDGIQLVDADLPDRPVEGVQWLRAPCQCRHCGHIWDMIAPLGWWGVECPECGSFDLEYQHTREGINPDDDSDLR